ncbi:MAG: TatD family hydrolase [Candidatus Yanofskybacteria bacterium]|nr:TatD family hydrolase [Candidatus Yanofskybacteria bacterium]
MKIVDTHCHVQMEQYDHDRDEVIRRARNAGIGMICVGFDLASSRAAIGAAEKYEGLYAAVGLHPNDNLTEEYDQAEYEELARHPRVVAIGEIGLDYFRVTDPRLKEIQRARFLQQLGMAAKPIIVHCRDAHTDMLSMLAGKELRGVIHSFTGTTAEMRAYCSLGWHIGLNAIATFSADYVDMIRAIPADRLLLETDAPYLAPVPYRGKRNEPSYIEGVGKFLADVRGVLPEDLFRQTTENAKRLFSL